MDCTRNGLHSEWIALGSFSPIKSYCSLKVCGIGKKDMVFQSVGLSIQSISMANQTLVDIDNMYPLISTCVDISGQYWSTRVASRYWSTILATSS
jgi:hypothetical protein